MVVSIICADGENCLPNVGFPPVASDIFIKRQFKGGFYEQQNSELATGNTVRFGGGVAAQVAELKQSIQAKVDELRKSCHLIRVAKLEELTPVVSEVKQLIQFEIKETMWGFNQLIELSWLLHDGGTLDSIRDRVSLYREMGKYFASKDNNLGLAYSCRILGGLYKDRDIDPSTAAMYFKQSASYYLKTNQLDDAQEVLCLAGFTYKILDNMQDMASICFMESLVLAVKSGDTNDVKRMKTEAENAFKKYQEFRSIEEMPRNLLFCQEIINTGLRLIAQKEYVLANDFLDRAYPMAAFWDVESRISKEAWTKTDMIDSDLNFGKILYGRSQINEMVGESRLAIKYKEQAGFAYSRILKLVSDYPFSDEDEKIIKALGITQP